ncbi:MAG: NUDIX domain-containing protein [Gammaproteobacteria bacterium]|nr:NUDIX domain-containing protein [Gammaproteobacteria bacterium]
MTTRSRFDIIVHTFVFDCGRLLLLRRANTGFLDGYYSLPGGHVEAGEEIAEAAAREVREEARIEVLEIEPVIVMSYGDGVDFLFEARRWSGTAQIGEPDRCDDLVWVRPDRLPEKTAPYLQKALELRSAGTWYHEFR